MRRFFVAGLVGALLTTALTAVLWAAHGLAGLPFVPFDQFDVIARTLPGAVVTFGIDTMVAAIRGLDLGDTSQLAKLGEQTLAVTLFLLEGIVLATAALCPPGRLRDAAPWTTALAAGAIMAALGVAATLAGMPPPAGTLIGSAWAAAAGLGWGAAVGYSGTRMGLPGRVPDPERGPEHIERARSPDAGASVDRRRFLVRLGGATAAVTVTGAVVGSVLGRGGRGVPAGDPWSASHPLPHAGADLDPAPGTRAELTPVARHYRIDINTMPPRVDGDGWRLGVGGLVERPLELTLQQLRSYEPLHQFITLECISNPIAGDLIGTTRWTGVSLQRLLPDLRLREGATHLRIRAADGFDEVLPLAAVRADERVMLTYAWDGLPLTVPHGFPLRLYWPNRFGMKQPKWIESIEAVGEWTPGYWVRRGWDAEAIMKPTSVIDTVAVDDAFTDPDGTRRVPIGGIAFAGNRSISAVELRVDDGPWQPARLRDPLSDRTWVLWRFDWPFEEGPHTFTVRCRTGTGQPQPDTPAPVRPAGAAGLHHVQGP